MAAPDIFLSYNREDLPRAKVFAEAFAAEGFEVWWDATLRSGDEYDRITEQALADASAVVVLWSKKSVESRWVRAEATEAQRMGTLRPAMIEPCKRPIMFELTHTADLSHWKGDRADPAWRAFVADLEQMTGEREGAAAAAPAAHSRRAGRAGSRPLFLAGVVVALLALLGGGYLLTRGSGPLAGVLGGEEERVPVLVRAIQASGSGDATEAQLAGGITDELINRLRRIPELQIGTAQADGSAPSDAFAAAHVVEGTIRSNGDQLRVTARLFDPEGEILWSQTFDQRLLDLFQLQEEIAASIAGALSVPLDVGTNARAYGGTNNPEAYAAYVQGVVHTLDFDQSVPVRYLERAIELDPDYVRAHVQLASTYGNRIPTATSGEDMRRMMAEMNTASARALEANPDLPSGNVVRAWYYVTRKDLLLAEGRMARAAELDAGIDPQLRTALAQYAVTMGRSRKALEISRSKALIDPVYERDSTDVFHLMMNRRYREAIELFEELQASGNPAVQPQLFHVFWARILAGEEREAIEWASGFGFPMDAVAAQLQDFERIGLVGKDLAQVRQWAARTFGEGGQYQIANHALAAAYKGHPRLAVDLLRVAFERPGGYALFYFWHPAMAQARKTDAFARLVEDIGFVDAWRESGDWGDFCRPAEGGGVSCS